MVNFLNQILYKRIIIILLCITNFVFGQESSYKLDILYYPNNGEYWWLTRNNEGRYIHNKSINFEWRIKNKSTSYRITLSDAFSKNKEISFGESFIKYNFSENLFLRTGKYYRDFSLYLNDELSSGSMLVSKNAQPLPKIGLVGSLIVKKNKNIFFDWGIAHGVFKTNQYYTNAPFLHEKFFYLNVSKNGIHNFRMGLVHEAIWAGTTTEIGSTNNPGNQPDSFKDFLKIFIAADGPLIPGEAHANALGSHSGIWDFVYTRKNINKELKFYYQHYFEDTSSLRFANKTDGLWGIELKNYLPKTNLLLEYLDTSHCCINPPYQDDNYYYNYQYRDGWKYNNMIIGNPFVNSEKSRDAIRLFHIGVSTIIKKNIIKIKFSRKTSRHDIIKYKASINREMKKTNIHVFIGGNEHDRGGGIALTYKFNAK